MPLKWRARLTWAGCMVGLATLVLVIGPHRIDQSPWYAGLVILPLLILVAAQLFAFRCPHCGERAVRGHYGYWVASDTCAKCLRDFEGASLSDDQLAEKLIAEDNPELAQKLRQRRLEEEELRKRAPTDAQAAAILEGMLKERLEGVEAWVRDMQRLYALKQTDKADLVAAEVSLNKLQADLRWCMGLTSGPAQRSRLTCA